MISNFKKLSTLAKTVIVLFIGLWLVPSIPAVAEIPYDSCTTKVRIVIKHSIGSRSPGAGVYTGSSRDSLFFKANSKQGRSYQLFVFNMDGRLIKQSTIHEKQTALLTQIEKGNYLFEVFSNDMRIENGSIVIR